MRYSANSIAALALVVLLSSCNADQSAGNSPSGSQGTQFTPGCTTAPACGTCQTCAEQCYCATGDIARCAALCGGSDGGVSAWNSTGTPTAGATGTATSTPTGTATSTPTGTATSTPTGTATSTPTGTATSTPTGTDTSVPIEPPPDTNAFTITTSTFQIPAGGEVYKCQNFRNPLGTDVAIVESSSFMAPGSHHMFVFHDASFNQDTNAVSDCSGVEFHDYLHVAQVPQETITYPSGVGRSLKGGEGLRILAHYLNTNSTTLDAQVAVTFKYVQPTEVQYLAAQMFLNQGTLLVPPGVSTKSRTFTVPYDIEMLYAVSHMHKHGTHFVATTNQGQTVYDGTDWDEPKETAFSPPMHISGGSVMTWACTFNNDTAQYLTFGESAQDNEMCILNAVFYPSDASQHQGAPLDTNF